VGGMVPVVFSALAMNAVGKAAMEMVNEVVRQFKEIPGIMEGTGKPEYDKCVAISTQASLKEMMLPGILTIGFPIVIVLIGLLVYPDNNMLVAEMLGGYMAGVTVSGVLWAIFQNNAGGAWDNAKKSFEAGVEINGVMTYKGSDAHKAAVTGDTVGDPFKDTSGPSMNILIKLTCLIGLVIAPILGGHATEDTAVDATQENTIQVDTEKQVIVEMSSDDNQIYTATVTITDKEDGYTTKVTKVFKGTKAEVTAEIDALEATQVVPPAPPVAVSETENK
jgi:K(+)-stimulated pyrophosphate-energized sodium pump